MNFGHAAPGLGAWPRAKSKPVAEYCTVLSVSTPMAFDALLMTALASCADAVQTSTAASPNTARDFFNICVPLQCEKGQQVTHVVELLESIHTLDDRRCPLGTQD